MSHRAYRRSALLWPWTPAQLADLNDDIDRIYRELKAQRESGDDVLDVARFPGLTGDVTAPAGSIATTLATVNANVGTFGSGTAIPTVTVNAKGLITAVTETAVSTFSAAQAAGYVSLKVL